MNQPAATPAIEQIGRYVLHAAIARGGMATVHAARLVAGEGVTRLVAAKRLHPQFTDDPEFVAMFHDEARIAARIHHPNVVPVLDVIHSEDEVILVQEYVHGVTLSHLFKLALVDTPIPVPIAAAVIAGILEGLHAAHEATDELGEPLGVVHRDVSPQNIIVSVDGIPRLVDFGIAKAKSSLHETREGFFKGKLAYMGPEQLRGELVTRQADIYAAGVLLWELAVNRRFYDGQNDADFVRTVALGSSPTLTEVLESERANISEERWQEILRLEPIVTRALSISPNDRYATAVEMAAALMEAVRLAGSNEVATWVRSVGADYLDKRQRVLVANEESYRAGPSSQLSVARRVIDIDEGVRSSGARMKTRTEGRIARVDDANRDAIAFGDRAAAEIEPTAATRLASASRLDQRVETRTLVPWTVVAGLLIVIGLLTGMALVRAPAQALAPAAPALTPAAPALTVTASRQQPSVSIAPLPTAPPEPEVPPVAAPTITSRSVATPPVARWFPPAKSAYPPRAAAPAPMPVPTPAAPAASARPECTPPFYFEGTKKVFKPSCL